MLVELCLLVSALQVAAAAAATFVDVVQRQNASWLLVYPLAGLCGKSILKPSLSSTLCAALFLARIQFHLRRVCLLSRSDLVGLRESVSNSLLMLLV